MRLPDDLSGPEGLEVLQILTCPQVEGSITNQVAGRVPASRTSSLMGIGCGSWGGGILNRIPRVQANQRHCNVTTVTSIFGLQLCKRTSVFFITFTNKSPADDRRDEDVFEQASPTSSTSSSTSSAAAPTGRRRAGAGPRPGSSPPRRRGLGLTDAPAPVSRRRRSRPRDSGRRRTRDGGGRRPLSHSKRRGRPHGTRRGRPRTKKGLLLLRGGRRRRAREVDAALVRSGGRPALKASLWRRPRVGGRQVLLDERRTSALRVSFEQPADAPQLGLQMRLVDIDSSSP